jgi:hypothetical protein
MRRMPAVMVMFLLVASAPFLAAQDASSNETNAEFWRSMPKKERVGFIFGFGLGVKEGMLATVSYLHDHDLIRHGSGTNLAKALTASVDTRFSSGELEPVVTDLYKDPANALIDLNDAILIARDRLSGKDVEAAIRAARKSGADLNDQMRTVKP